MRKRSVRFRHLVRILALLDSAAQIVAGVHDLAGQTLAHGAVVKQMAAELFKCLVFQVVALPKIVIHKLCADCVLLQVLL